MIGLFGFFSLKIQLQPGGIAEIKYYFVNTEAALKKLWLVIYWWFKTLKQTKSKNHKNIVSSSHSRFSKETQIFFMQLLTKTSSTKRFQL